MQDIRLLVNYDSETPTGKVNEDQAYQKSQELFHKYTSDFAHDLQSFDAVGFKKGESEAERKSRTIEVKIAIIKKNENNKYDYYNLNYYHDSLVEMEKLFKLTPEQLEIKT